MGGKQAGLCRKYFESIQIQTFEGFRLFYWKLEENILQVFYKKTSF